MAMMIPQDWQHSFCPFDAIGVISPTPIAPEQTDFAKTVRIARFVTDPARLSGAGTAANGLPYTRKQIDQAVNYFTQQHDETVDTIVWEWAYQEYLVFQHNNQYVRTWAPEMLRWENVVLAEPIVVNLHNNSSAMVTDDHSESFNHPEGDEMNCENDTNHVHSLSQHGGANGNLTVNDKQHQTDISAPGLVSDPVTPSQTDSRSSHTQLIPQKRTSLTLCDRSSPVLGESPCRARSFPPRRRSSIQDSDSNDGCDDTDTNTDEYEEEDGDEYENDDIQYDLGATRTRLTRQSSLSSPVKGDIVPQHTSPDTAKKKRAHKRIHKTGVFLGFHRRQLQKLPRAQMPGPTSTGNSGWNQERATRAGRDHRQIVHGIVDGLGRVHRCLRPTNMAGKLVPDVYRLKGVNKINGESIVYLAQFKNMSHEEINDEVVRLTAEAKEKEQFGGMRRSL